MVYDRIYDRSANRYQPGAHGPQAEPGSGVAWSAAMWQDDVGAAVRCPRTPSIISTSKTLKAWPDWPNQTPPCARCEGWSSSTKSNAVRNCFRLLRVLADRKPLPARFLILGSAAPDLTQPIVRIAGRTPGNRAPGGLSLAGPGPQGPRPALAAGRFSAGLHGQKRRRFAGLAAAIPADLSGTRHSAVGHPDSGHGPGAVLEHARPLPRPNLERGRAGPRAGRQRIHRAPLPRSLDRRVHGAATSAVV